MPPIRFSRALYDFEAYLEVEKNLSPRTRKAYVYDLERFMDHWISRHKQNPTLDKITTLDIQRYLEHLRLDRNYKSTTLSRTIASIRVFFEFCVMRDFLENSPASHLHNPKNPKKLPVFLVQSEMKKILSSPETSEAEAASRRSDYRELGKRDYAILAVFGFTGLRLQELVGMNLGDIDFENKSIRVMGKGSKERIVPLNETVIQALQGWIESREPADPADEAVFLNRFGKRISGRGVQQMVEKHVRKAGISKDGLSPHKLRHTFATLLHMHGVDVLEIQALLGHASILSTQVYTHASSSKLKSAVKKLDNL
ncbi:MAG: tyrosine recombinase XerC [Candidatus Sumerlaeia bacterium]